MEHSVKAQLDYFKERNNREPESWERKLINSMVEIMSMYDDNSDEVRFAVRDLRIQEKGLDALLLDTPAATPEKEAKKRKIKSLRKEVEALTRKGDILNNINGKIRDLLHVR